MLVLTIVNNTKRCVSFRKCKRNSRILPSCLLTESLTPALWPSSLTAWRAASMVWTARCFRCVVFWMVLDHICHLQPVLAAAVFIRLRRSYWLLTLLSSLFLSTSYKRCFGSLTMSTARAYRTSRKCSSSRPAVEVSALQDEHGVAAPGQPPPSSHFPVCSSQVLLDPLGTSFCLLLPPPLLLCKCPRCMGCAGTWAAHGSQVGQLSAPPCLFSGLFWGLWLFSVLTSNLMCSFCYFFQLRISYLFFLSLSLYPFLFFFLHLLSTFSFFSTFHLLCHPCLPASSSLCHAGQRAPGHPRLPSPELLPSLFFLACSSTPRTLTTLSRHAGLLTGRKPVITKN